MESYQIYEDEDKNKENFRDGIAARPKNAKQPLGLLNANKINQKQAGYVPAPSGRGQQSFQKVKNVENVEKKSNELQHVVEQLKNLTTIKSEVSTGDNLPGRDIHGSPMSVDHTIIEVFSSDTKQNVNKNYGNLIKTSHREYAYEEVQYQMDMLVSSREGELKHRPKAEYMLRQKDISHRMRSILIDWLVAVAVDYNLNPETLYLAVSYTDRFLSQVAVMRHVLQLVGITSLCIACKYEEIVQPQVAELIYITDNSYTKEEMLHLERFMLKVLGFNLVTPTAYAFIKQYALMCDDMSEILKCLTMYISELSLLRGDPFLHYLPSQISSAALALARHILGMEMWSPRLEEITTYKLKDLRTVVLVLANTHSSARELKMQAIQEKYTSDRYKNVATIKAIELTMDNFDQICLAYDAKQMK